MSILDEICDHKREEVRRAKSIAPLPVLREKIAEALPPRSFMGAIRDKASKDQPALIAEIKKASPSGGVIRDDIDPPATAKAYQKGGAACLSVLTDRKYFKGADSYLKDAREATSLPVLRKDFIIDDYQIYESRAIGADCILLIMAAIDDKQAADYARLAGELSMDVLVEVHDRQELERALNLDPAMIGINNRNLKTLEVDLQTGLDLGESLPDDVIKVAESGIGTAKELHRFHEAGFHAFLVGETLMRKENPAAAVEDLLARPAA